MSILKAWTLQFLKQGGDTSRFFVSVISSLEASSTILHPLVTDALLFLFSKHSEITSRFSLSEAHVSVFLPLIIRREML